MNIKKDRIITLIGETQYALGQLCRYKNEDADLLANKLSEMAKFRNLLVHLYWKVDNKRVIEIAQNELGSFKEFIYLIGQMVND